MEEKYRERKLDTKTILTFQNLKGIGNKTILKLGENLPSIKNITQEDLRKAREKAENIISRSEEEGVGIISYYDEVYPEILKGCVREDGKLDPPLILYYRGNLEIMSKPGIAIIGTREPTNSGKIAAEFFSSEFAKLGANIVSGLAKGCDTYGHIGALNVGGSTTAFLGGGLDWSSVRNPELAKRIVNEGGLLMSEYPIGQECSVYGLVARDRLQAGLSKATVVIQAGIKSGTMYAIKSTLASGKPLYAVKYCNPEDLCYPNTQANSLLISEGKAIPLTSKTDLQTILQNG